MKKCDVVIPVYNSPEWVKLCVYSIIKNTSKDVLNQIIMVDDCSDDYTKNCLRNLQQKYGDLIKLVTNKENLGFVKTCNKALMLSKSDYILLLNTDCILSPNTIQKLIDHMEKDNKIGLICPIASNAANITLEMFEGFSYTQMDKLLEKKFSGMNFDACTVVGNCLMISRPCFDAVGKLDEIYGTGYGEETDYQFKSMEKGFTAKVAIDTYVFHKSEASFGTSKEKKERLEKNREIFFSRWGVQYKKLLKLYDKNDPIKYINENLTEEDKNIAIDTLIYLPDLVQNAGGVHVVVDMVNYLSINGLSTNILYNHIANYQEIMLFNPISAKKVDSIKIKQIVATIYTSSYFAKEISKKKRVPLINFVQGYEPFFENGAIYGIAELTYKIADYNLTISEYLKKELETTFDTKAELIHNGIHYDLIHCDNKRKKIKTITMILRNNPMKGDWILMDIIKKINNQFNNLTVNILYSNEYIEFPKIDNPTIKFNKYLGPFKRTEINRILQTSDVFIDASLSEGFGLMALEAMAAGNVPIVSNSLGINAYIKNNKNGILIDKINESDIFIESLKELINNPDIFVSLKSEALETAKDFDYDNVINKYIEYFKENKKRLTQKQEYNQDEKIIIGAFKHRNKTAQIIRGKAYYISKVIPKPIKNKMKKVITLMYNTYQH